MRHHHNQPALHRSRILAIVAFLWLLAAAGLAASAQATTYTVGTVSDSATGACPEPKAGTCSLRQLIEFEDELAVTPKPADTIVVPAGKYGLTQGELVITQSLGIQGAGARKTFVSQSRGAEQRVFKIELPKSEKAPTVTISGLEISGGTAGEKNGSFGGDVYNAGELVLLEDWIAGGTASSGGGISNNTGTLVVRRSLVSSNHASTGGGDSGGIQNHGSEICNAACFPGKKAVLTIEDSTVADNDARLGAGVFSWSDAVDGNEVTVTRSTIADNSTEEEGTAPARGLGGGLLISDGKADVTGSILAFNSATINGTFFQSNCSTGENGSIVSLGYNLETETDCGFQSKGDLQQEFARFNFAGELQDNGGSTDTLAPEATSAGVDAIPTKEPLCTSVDQRGIARPQGAACDMGAVELVPFTIHATAGTSFSGVVAESPPCGVFREPEPTIDWGDGKTSAGSTAEEDITGTHTYGKAGTYNGSVTYNNDCGQGTHVVPFQAQVVGPPVISEAKAGAVTETTGKAEFTLAPAGSETTYEVEYGLDTKYGSKTTAAKLAGGAGPTHEVVTISGLKPNTTYHFRVVATNAQAPGGVRSGDLSFATVGPPVVSEVKAGAVTETTGKAEFTLDPGHAETTYEVEYGLDTKYGSKTTAAKLAAGAGPTHEVVTISGLKPNTTYHFRVVATNAQAPGGVRSGDLTLATVGPPVLSEVKAGAVTETTGKAEFTLDPAGSETTYEVEYGLDTQYGSTTTAAKLAGGAGPTHEVVTISGLKANTTYHFRVVATNAQAPGGVRSGDLSFATVGPPVLSAVKAGPVTETTGKVEFTIDPAGSETTYEVEYGLDTKYGSKTTAAKLAGGAGPTSEVVTISGLKPNTTYHFRVAATNAQAPGGVRSGDLTLATVGPPVISEVKAGAVTETTGKAEFTLDPAGSETTYEVEYGLDTKYGSKTTAAKLAGGAGPTHEVVTISGLKANTTYHFRVVATNAQALGGVRSGDATFATVGPPVLSEVRAGATTETTGKVEFTIDPAGSETTYEVEYGLDTKYGSKTAAVKLSGGAGPTPEIVTISSLKPNNTYHFRVVATNAQAPGGVRSSDLTFATVASPVLSGVKAGAVTETTGKVEFTVDPAGSEATVEVEYGLDTKYGSKTSPLKVAGNAGPTSEVVTISGLKPNNTYHFRVVATNAQAPGGVRSSDLTFATVGPPVITEAKAGAVTETTGKVEFTLDTAHSETTYEVEYGLDTKYGSKTTPAKLAGGAGPTHEVVTISGLKANTTYHFRVVATNAQAPGGVRSGDRSFATVGPPVVSEVDVVVVTETTVEVAFTVDPAGEETTYEVDYGPDASYGQKTSPVKLAGGSGPTHEVVTISGLTPGSTYHFAIVATNAQAAGGVKGADQPVTTAAPGGGGGGGGGGGVLTNPGGGVLGTQTTGPATLDTLPPPVLGKTFNIEPVSGKVFISLPPGAHLTRAGFSFGARESLSKGLHFIPLTEARQIPVGSTLETTAGVARIETATVGKPQIGDFGAGIFKLLQQRKQRGLTELNIVNNVAPKKVCATLGKGAASAAKLSSKVLGRIHGSAHGRFVTKGQYSAATVRGTIWSVQNQCNGTLTKVTRDVVTVRDFRRRKTITLLSGQSYLARAPGRRSR
jgi:phosphodiesterase/alkaline phosphatase D-like protein